jgi:DNA-binding MarR family transcriptional regulator
VLRIVQEQPGLSAGEIAKLMHLDKSTLTGVFRRLEERRLIVRELDGGDRRRARFRLGRASRRVSLIDVPSLESAVAAAFAKAPQRARRSARDVLAAVCARLEWQVTHQVAVSRKRLAPPPRTIAGRGHRRRSSS